MQISYDYDNFIISSPKLHNAPYMQYQYIIITPSKTALHDWLQQEENEQLL